MQKLYQFLAQIGGDRKRRRRREKGRGREATRGLAGEQEQGSPAAEGASKGVEMETHSFKGDFFPQARARRNGALCAFIIHVE